jgi:hypothetical protein
MKKLALALLILLLSVSARAQAHAPAADPSAQKARAALEAMVKALGGESWLNLKNQMFAGHSASFYQGKPNLGTTLFWEFHAWPGRDRIEYTKHRDVVQIYGPDRKGWEITYKGKAPLPQDQVDERLRRRDHSIETVAHEWLPDPRTILLYEGQHLVERHLAEQVTLISAANDSVTLMIDAQSHLPLRRSYEWRDPVYHDKNLDAEEYDSYRLVDGFPTPQAITRFKNNEMVSQRFIDRAAYNQDLADEFWSPEAAEKQIKK